MGVDKDTIQSWVEGAGEHVEEVSAYLTVNCHLSEAQLNALWTFVKKRMPQGEGQSRRNRHLLHLALCEEGHESACGLLCGPACLACFRQVTQAPSVFQTTGKVFN